MKIWFAAAIPADSQGGVNRNMIGFAEGLRNHGHAVDIIYAASPAQRNYLLFAVVLFLRVVMSGRSAPDVLIARSTDGVFCAFARRMGLFRTRILLHNHGWEHRVFEIRKALPEKSDRSFFTWKSRAIRFPLLSIMPALSDGCICGTLDEIRWLRKRYPRYRDKFFYAPNGVQSNKNISAKKWHPDFLCIGAWGWRKNNVNAMEILSEVKKCQRDARIVFVGTGLDAVPSTKAVRAQADMIQNVSVETMEKMSRWYEQCPFMITSSLYEGGHALVVLEAMAYGCVIFARNIPSAGEIISHGWNGFLLPGKSPEKDAAIIINALSDSQQLGIISLNARKSASRNSWERQAVRMEKILKLVTRADKK